MRGLFPSSQERATLLRRQLPPTRTTEIEIYFKNTNIHVGQSEKKVEAKRAEQQYIGALRGLKLKFIAEHELNTVLCSRALRVSRQIPTPQMKQFLILCLLMAAPAIAYRIQGSIDEFKPFVPYETGFVANVSVLESRLHATIILR